MNLSHQGEFPHIVAHAQWCSASALRRSSESCSGHVSELKPARLIIRVHCKHVGGFLFQPRVSQLCIFLGDQLFLLCSYHRGEMLSFDLFFSSH